MLFILLFALAAAEAYMAYFYLLPNLDVQDATVETKSVVRVDLKAYDFAINMLDHLETFQPKQFTLPRSNPFKF